MEELRVDYLVLGSGIAGLRAAIGLARSGSVLVVTKAQPAESNTGYAQGGVAVAMGPDDDEALHLADTMTAGAGIVSRPAARVLVEEGPERIRELASWGARFDREEGRFHFTREGAHSRNRVLHALGDATGWEMMRALLEKAQHTAGVSVRSYACSTDLVTHEGRVVGCRFLAESGSSESRPWGSGGEAAKRREAPSAARRDSLPERTAEVRVLARATLLATGGAGQVFRETTNPAVATGDGMAMALRAGAAMLDMEFVQFHPTALAVEGAPRFLLSEALRGEGARLLNAAGERFVDELRPRDQVARAIVREAREGRGPVRLDVRHLEAERIRVRFPRIHATCLRYGVDIATETVPVTPAAHYMMGGVATDLFGRCTVPGLYAAGEVAATGVHGANRLASNSLLEGLVFGARAALAMAGDGPGPPPGLPVDDEAGRPQGDARDPEDVAALIRDLAWTGMGLERTGEGLKSVLAELEPLGRALADRTGSRASAEARNLADVAQAMGRCALFREESRGGHFRTDFPLTDDRRFGGHTLMEAGHPRLADTDLPLGTATLAPAAAAAAPGDGRP